MKFSLNSHTLFSAGEDLHINITDVEALKRKQTLTGHSDWITSIAVSEKLFATASLDKTVKLWDLNTGKCIHT